MPILTVRGKQYDYETTGDGFPLLLTSGGQGTIAAWDAITPLLGEVCRVIAYEDRGLTPTLGKADACAEDLGALLEALGSERVYLATAGAAVRMALACAVRAPACLEALLLVGMPETAAADGDAAITVPTLILVGEQAPQQYRRAVALATQLSRGKIVLIPGAGDTPQHEQPRQLGHAMMDFLIDCERQRNLVRGASFLL